MPSKKVLLLTSIILFGIFVYFSYLVAKGRFTHFDFNTTVRIQNHISHRFDFSFSTLSVLGSPEITGVVWLGVLLFCLVKKYWLAILTLPLFIAGSLMEVYGKVFVQHPAPPFLFYRGVIQFSFPSQYVNTNYSYPSGHLTRTSFLATFLFLLFFYKMPTNLRWIFQLGALFFLVAMAISRIYLGEHWTSDVIGGTLLGSALGIFSGLTIPKRRKIQDQAAGLEAK